MLEQLTRQITNLAHSVDVRINLFEGYVPKQIESHKGELRFWREVVSIYAIFADCDRVQIKEKNNLFELMNRYALIEKVDYNFIKRFWDDISNLRKWFCHNNDSNMYFIEEKKKRITAYLNTAFLLNSNKPTSIEDIQNKDWNMICFNIESRYEEYLKILKKGLEAWSISDDKDELQDRWIFIFSRALYNDNELIMNVLADLASYNILNDSIRGIGTAALARNYFNQIKTGGFSIKDIENELRNNNKDIRSNKEIIYHAIVNSHLI